MLGQYLRGQLLVMLMLAAYYSVGLALFGFDLAVPVGVFTGLAIFIPYVGFGIGLVLALLAGVLQFSGWYGPIAVPSSTASARSSRASFLTPRLVGERIGMSPLDGDLRAARLRPPVRLRRRADRAAGERADRWWSLRAPAARSVPASSTPATLATAMKQIPLAIGPEPAQTFENFLPGAERGGAGAPAARSPPGAPPVYLWGPPGSGKTHLLHALAAARAARRARRAGWFDAGDAARHGASTERCAGSSSTTATRFDARSSRPRSRCSSTPPTQRRGDRRRRRACRRSTCRCARTCAPGSAGATCSRCSRWPRAEVRAALRREADRRGIFLSDEVMDYLLTRFARDLKHLMALLDRLDEFSLAEQRAITVPLLKQMLAEEGA